jgi:hypothetical protein
MVITTTGTHGKNSATKAIRRTARFHNLAPVAIAYGGVGRKLVAQVRYRQLIEKNYQPRIIKKGEPYDNHR